MKSGSIYVGEIPHTNLTFDPANGDALFNGTIADGDNKVSNASSNLNVTKVGADFIGWYAPYDTQEYRLFDAYGNLINSEGTKAWVNQDTGRWKATSGGTRDLNLTAHYLHYSVLNFYPENGVNTSFNGTIYDGNTTLFTCNGSLTLSKDSATFTGWYVNGTDVCLFNTTGALVVSSETLPWVSSTTGQWQNASNNLVVNLTAKYTSYTTLNFYPSNGNSKYSGQIYDGNSSVYSVTGGSLIPTKSNAVFTGWYEDSSNVCLINATGALVQDTNTTKWVNVTGYWFNASKNSVLNLTAHYVNYTTLNFYWDNQTYYTNGSISDGDTAVTINGTLIPTKTSAVFTGWYENSTKVCLINATGVLNTSASLWIGSNGKWNNASNYPALRLDAGFTVCDNTTLIFKWDNGTYFDTGSIYNGNVSAKITNGSFSPVKASANFTGWYTDTNVYLINETGYLIQSDATKPWVDQTTGQWYNSVTYPTLNLTASFAGITTLNLKFWNGTAYSTATVKEGDSTVTNTTSMSPALNGFTFKGWYLSTNTNTQILNAAGDFTSSNIPGYVTSGKWSNKTASSLDLVAKYDLDLTGTNLSGKSSQTLNSDGSYTIALSSDVTSTVVIPDTWGTVTLNLGGKKILPSTKGADGLVFTSNGGSGTNLVVTNGQIYGADGSSPSGNGGDGISSSGTGCTLTIATGTTVSGGDGAAGADNASAAGTNGGNGGNGISTGLTSVKILGTVLGGAGGNGGTTKSDTANAGNGGDGGLGSVVDPTNIDNGIVTGGNGGAGGDSKAGTQGTGGNGGASVVSTATVNVANKTHMYEGVPGAGGKNSSGSQGSAGSTPTAPTVNASAGTVIEVTSEDVGQAAKSLGVVCTNLTKASGNVSSSTAVRIDMTVTGEIKNTSSTTTSLYTYAKQQFSAATSLDVVAINITETNLTAGTAAVQLHETNGVLEIFVPYETSGKTIKVFRNHNGTNKAFGTTNVGGDGTFKTGTLSATGQSGVFIYSDKFSDFIIASATASNPTPSTKTTSSSAKEQSASQILPSNAYADWTPAPTSTPTPVATSLPIPTSSSTSHVYPTSSSPAPLLGLIAGLGAVAAVFGIRRIRR